MGRILHIQQLNRKLFCDAKDFELEIPIVCSGEPSLRSTSFSLRLLTMILVASNANDLCMMATIFESREWEKVPLDRAFLRELDGLLLEIYETLRPKPIHYERRNMLVNVFNKMVTEIFGNGCGLPVVEEFGSFKMDLFTPESDLDLSVNFSDRTSSTSAEYPRVEKIKAIRKLSKNLYAHQRQGHVRGVTPIVHARVPVLKVTDCGTGVECDISIENKDGISRSAIISLVSSIDERFRILSYLMKMWAKANDINSSKDRTMSSMAIIALVAFHLQTRSPPILPPFVDLLRGGTSISNIEKNVHHFKKFGRGNKESIAELFISLICKLTAVENLWDEGLCASMFEGAWLCKRIANSSKAAGMSVEDFLDRSENFARSVGKNAEMEMIGACTKRALNYLTSFLSGRIDTYKLRTYLFGRNFSTLSPIANVRDNNYNDKRLTWEDIPAPPIQRDVVPGQSKLDKKRKEISSEAHNSKRRRYDIPVAQQEPPPIFEDHYHQGPPFGFHLPHHEQRLPQIQHSIRDPDLSLASGNLSVPCLDHGQNLINPYGRGFVMMPNQYHFSREPDFVRMPNQYQFSHGPGISRSANFSYQYRQPDPVNRHGRGFRR